MIEWDSPDKFIGTTAAIIMGLSAAASAGGSVYSASKQSDAVKASSQLQATASDKQLQLAQQQEAEQEREFNVSQLLNYQQYIGKQNQLAPYRDMGTAANAKLAELMGLNLPAPTTQPIPTSLPTTLAPSATTTQAAPPTQMATPTTLTPQTTSVTPPSPVTPPPNGNYQAWFQNLTGGQPMNQTDLLALKPQLDAAGIQVSPGNKTDGSISKIGVPDGSGGTQWVRVLNGDTSQKSATVWIPEDTTGGSVGSDSSSKAATLLSLLSAVKKAQTPAATPASLVTTPALAAPPQANLLSLLSSQSPQSSAYAF